MQPGAEGHSYPGAIGVCESDRCSDYPTRPSAFWECERYGRELAAKRTVEVRKFRFYERPLAVSPDAVARLLSVSTSTSTFRAWRGGAKGCGDFHPDFALVWKAGAKTYELLLCFGCKEARLSGENIDLWFDMVSAVTFESTLEPFRQHRPLGWCNQ